MAKLENSGKDLVSLLQKSISQVNPLWGTNKYLGTNSWRKFCCLSCSGIDYTLCCVTNNDIHTGQYRLNDHLQSTFSCHESLQSFLLNIYIPIKVFFYFLFKFGAAAFNAHIRWWIYWFTWLSREWWAYLVSFKLFMSLLYCGIVRKLVKLNGHTVWL